MAEGEEGGGGLHVPEGAKTKVLGLPLWVIVGAGAGLLGILIFLRSRNSATTTTAQPTAVSDPLAGTVTDTGTSGTLSDPMTIAELTAALQNFQNKIQQLEQNQSNTTTSANRPATTQSPANKPGQRGTNQSPPASGGPRGAAYPIAASTSRTTGGRSTQATASGPTKFKPTRIPILAPSRVQWASIRSAVAQSPINPPGQRGSNQSP